MKDIVLEIIQRMEAEKKRKKIEPDFVILSDLQSEVEKQTKDALNDLFKNGKIQVGVTLNGKYIKTL